MSFQTSLATTLSALVLSACGPSSSPDAPLVDARSGDGSQENDAQDPDGMSGAYSHSIVIDGTNDFDPIDERFLSSSPGYSAYLAWDQTYLYLAMQGEDIGSVDPSRFLLVYLGSGGTGSTSGVTYNTQEPALPFTADYHLRWKADSTFTNAVNWDGKAWVDAGWDFSDDIVQSGEFLELRIPLADIGAPISLSVHLYMINESSGIEFSFAGMPGDSFADGYDPDLGKYYQFDLRGQTPPASHAELP